MPSKPSIDSLLDKVERVPITSIKPYPGNPRQGNVTMVKESLIQNGQFRPLIVQRSTKFILAGNHTWLAARQITDSDVKVTKVKGKTVRKKCKPWTHIDITVIDVDDEAAKRIVLADNKTSDASGYDDEALAKILAEIATTDIGLDGTGYDPAELQDLIDSVGKGAAQAGADLDDLMANMPKTEMRTKSLRDQYKDEEDDDEGAQEARKARGATKEAKPAEDDIDDIEDAEAELQAVLEVKVENIEFWKQAGKDSGDDFEIPYLRDDMLMEEIPEPLKTWAGHDVTPDDGETWFLYNYSLGGIKGLPFERSILSFFTHDDKFLGWWDTPAWYTCRVLSKGCRNAIVPDFSFYYTMPRAAHLWNVYRSLWIGRFFQESGMRVAPRLQFDFEDKNTLDIGLRGIPKGVPVLATSQQNLRDEDAPKARKILREALDEIQPQSLIYYSGPPGKRIMESVGWKGEVVYLDNYVAMRREVAFGKKEGLAGQKAKNRAKVLNRARKRLQAGVGDDSPDDDN